MEGKFAGGGSVEDWERKEHRKRKYLTWTRMTKKWLRRQRLRGATPGTRFLTLIRRKKKLSAGTTHRFVFTGSAKRKWGRGCWTCFPLGSWREGNRRNYAPNCGRVLNPKQKIKVIPRGKKMGGAPRTNTTGQMLLN